MRKARNYNSSPTNFDRTNARQPVVQTFIILYRPKEQTLASCSSSDLFESVRNRSPRDVLTPFLFTDHLVGLFQYVLHPVTSKGAVKWLLQVF